MKICGEGAANHNIEQTRTFITKDTEAGKKNDQPIL
jgi:hypothetical protein